MWKLLCKMTRVFSIDYTNWKRDANAKEWQESEINAMYQMHGSICLSALSPQNGSGTTFLKKKSFENIRWWTKCWKRSLVSFMYNNVTRSLRVHTSYTHPYSTVSGKECRKKLSLKIIDFVNLRSPKRNCRKNYFFSSFKEIYSFEKFW
jgi:hypothetical protein